MPTYDDETRQFLNTGFADRLEQIDNSTVNIIIEVEPGNAGPLLDELGALREVTPEPNNIVRDRFVPARVPVDSVERIANLEMVEKVHHDQPSGVFSEWSLSDAVRDFSLQNDPIRGRINKLLARRLTPTDDLADQIGIGHSSVPRFNYFQAPLGDPIRVGMSAVQRVTGSDVSGIEYIPTSESVEWMLDGDLVDGDHGGNTEIAILDTGHVPVEPSEGRRFGHIESLVPGEPPIDGHAHGCASPDTKVHTTLTGIDTMKGVWGALTERCDTEPLDNGADEGDTIPNPVMGDGHSPLRVQTLDKGTGEVETKPVDEMYRIEVDEDIFTVTLASGTTLELTPWHPTLVFRDGGIKKVRADELEEGDDVLAPDTRKSFYGPSRALPVGGDNGWCLTKEKAWAVGAFLGDGNARRDDDNYRYEVSLSNNDVDVHKKFAESLSDVGGEARLRAADGSGATSVSSSGVADPEVLGRSEGKRLVTTKYGKEATIFVGEVCGDCVFGKGKSQSISIPEVVENSREEVIGSFVAGYFDADGHIKAEKPKVIFSTSSEQMSEDLVYLLSGVGIDSRVGVLNDKRDSGTVKGQNGPSYRVVVSGGPDLQRFVRLVSGEVVSEDKRQRLMERLYEADFDHHQVSGKKAVGEARADPVVDVDTKPYDGYFYDFHIEDNHNYVAGKDGFAFISNSWCTYTAVGKSAPSVWGRVDGVASGADYSHYKVLNVFPGFGRTSWIMKAMERAVDRGADVVNMSLGGPQQGSVEEDPYCQLIDELCKENLGEDEGAIFVVAAGNAGPERWSIGTPGVAPKALTVGSWSLMDDEPAVFSSRGPQGAYYKDRPDEFESDLRRYGADEFVKPDVAAPGGGRANDELTAELDEMLHQTCAGWLEGMYDGLKDGRGSMKGTSMSAPHVAGLVALLYEAGIVKNASEIKDVVSEQEEIPQLNLATESARETEGGKNIAAGFGRIRESTFIV